MKTYKLFTEAISARRERELRKKGKGDALDAKMKADGLESERGGAIVPTKGKITQPKGQLAKPQGFKPADRGGAIMKTKTNAIKHVDRVQKTKVKAEPPKQPSTSKTYDNFKKEDKKEENKKKLKDRKVKKQNCPLGQKKVGTDKKGNPRCKPRDIKRGVMDTLKKMSGPDVKPQVSSGEEGKSTLITHTGGSKHF